MYADMHESRSRRCGWWMSFTSLVTFKVASEDCCSPASDKSSSAKDDGTMNGIEEGQSAIGSSICHKVGIFTSKIDRLGRLTGLGFRVGFRVQAQQLAHLEQPHMLCPAELRGQRLRGRS